MILLSEDLREYDVELRFVVGVISLVRSVLKIQPALIIGYLWHRFLSASIKVKAVELEA